MKSKHKTLLLVLCVVALVAGTALGTFAYLTDTEAVTNTFTVGQIGLSLDEAKVDEYGQIVTGAGRVHENTYKLVPGRTYTKDPTVHVDAGSEESYIFVKVENGIAAIEGGTTIAAQIAAKGWTALENGSNIYWKKWLTTDAKDLTVFESFTIAGETTNTEIADYENKTVVVTAYAVQTAGFGTAADAWGATFGKPTT